MKYKLDSRMLFRAVRFPDEQAILRTIRDGGNTEVDIFPYAGIDRIMVECKKRPRNSPLLGIVWIEVNDEKISQPAGG